MLRANFTSCVSGLKTLLGSSWSPFLYPQGKNPELGLSRTSIWVVDECRLSEACLPTPAPPHLLASTSGSLCRVTPPASQLTSLLPRSCWPGLARPFLSGQSVFSHINPASLKLPLSVVLTVMRKVTSPCQTCSGLSELGSEDPGSDSCHYLIACSRLQWLSDLYLVKQKQHTGLFSKISLCLWLSVCPPSCVLSKGCACLSGASCNVTTSEKPPGLTSVLHPLQFPSNQAEDGGACCTALRLCSMGVLRCTNGSHLQRTACPCARDVTSPMHAGV